jgi:type IV secretory pathway TrbL component
MKELLLSASGELVGDDAHVPFEFADQFTHAGRQARAAAGDDGEGVAEGWAEAAPSKAGVSTGAQLAPAPDDLRWSATARTRRSHRLGRAEAHDRVDGDA